MLLHIHFSNSLDALAGCLASALAAEKACCGPFARLPVMVPNPNQARWLRVKQAAVIASVFDARGSAGSSALQLQLRGPPGFVPGAVALFFPDADNGSAAERAFTVFDTILTRSGRYGRLLCILIMVKRYFLSRKNT